MPHFSSQTPLVSVIIPTYNLAQYIVETLESVLMQTYANMEVIIIDDGSQDHTDEVLAPYMDKIIYVYQDNQGISTTYNNAIAMAKGELVCFLEADDYWTTTDKVQKQVDLFLADPSIDYNLTGWQDVDPSGEKILNIVTFWDRAPNLTIHEWFLWLPTRLQCLMVTKACLVDIGGFDVKYRYAMDVELFLNIAVSGYKGSWLREITTAYRIHPISTSHTKRVQQGDEAMAIIEYYVHHDSLPEDIRKASKVYLFFKYLLFMRSTVLNGYPDDALRYAKKSFDNVWFAREYSVYDLATYTGDNFSYSPEQMTEYPEVIQLLRRAFPMADEVILSYRLSIETDTLLHWWVCIWWRYYHYMTPENIETPIDRHEQIFRDYAIAYYQDKSIEEIIHIARFSILASPLQVNERSISAIDLFWKELKDYKIISATADASHLIDLYTAIATRALYFQEWDIVRQALAEAVKHTQLQTIGKLSKFGLSFAGFIGRKIIGRA